MTHQTESQTNNGTFDGAQEYCIRCYERKRRICESVVICKKCGNQFCRSCFDVHLPQLKLETCKEHSKVCDKICLDHLDLVCNECERQNHPACCIIPLSDIDTFNQNKTSTFISDFLTTNHQKYKDIFQQLDASERTITSVFNRTMKKLKSQKKYAVQEIKRLTERQLKRLEDLEEDVSLLRKIFENIKRAKQPCQHQSETELADTLHRIKLKSEELYKQPEWSAIPRVWIALEKYIDELFGAESTSQHEKHRKNVYMNAHDLDCLSGIEELKTTESYYVKSADSTKQKMQLSGSATFAISLDSLQVKTSVDKDDCCITGLCVTKNGCLVLCDCYNKSVKMFSEEGEYISCYQTQGEPWDITVTEQNEAAVSFWDNQKSIQLLQLTNKSLRLQKLIKLKNRVYGITAVGDQIAVTSDDTIPGVMLMTKEGSILWTKQFDAAGKKLFKSPGYIICGQFENTECLLVSDKETSVVTILNAKVGDVLKVTLMNNAGPNGLSVDSFGNVFVGLTYLVGICLFPPDMTEHKMLKEQDAITRPQAIVFNSWTNELIVSSWRSNSLQRFKIFK